VLTQERTPMCPACGKRMTLARVTGRAYGRYRLITYECEACQVAYTEAGPEGDGALEAPED
jgi:rubredoxin